MNSNIHYVLKKIGGGGVEVDSLKAYQREVNQLLNAGLITAQGWFYVLTQRGERQYDLITEDNATWEQFKREYGFSVTDITTGATVDVSLADILGDTQ